MNLFREVADIKTADQLHLPTPEVEYHNIVAQPTEQQKEMVQVLSERASKVHSGSVDPSVDNMLKITGDGRKLGLDQRIINQMLPDEPGTKVNQCVGNIMQIWRDGEADKLTQLVFCDISTPQAAPSKKAAKALDNPTLHALEQAVPLDEPEPAFTIYEDIRQKLIAQGMPAEQIAFIHEAKSEVQKKELFSKVRTGQVRVLLGSTSKMGAGTNVQDRLVALHDLDCPWRPGDLAQRKGRIERQGNSKAVRRLSDTICIENGLSIVETPKPHGKSYNKWLGDQAKPSHRELLRTAIDNALALKPTDLDALLKLLRESGCEVSKRGKSYRLKLPGWGKVSRLDSLGDGYTLEDLLAVLAGQKDHTPRRKLVKQADPPKVNLLVDIQAKLQAGKGAGYARWAKVFNLKQMAQTVNYLTEHQLLDYTELAEKAAAATAYHNELSAKIKAAEKRMTEIAVLRTHIINYAKTRDTYVAYRKAGYSKNFRQEHEEEILLHQAAKNAFDDMGVKKLPKVKELQAEYGRLLEEKKKTYAEYRRSREEMRELLAAKANVDRLLKMDEEQKKEKEKDHGQR